MEMWNCLDKKPERSSMLDVEKIEEVKLSG